MKNLILGLVIAIAFSGPAWGGEFDLKYDSTRRALAEYDRATADVLNGEGYITDAHYEECKNRVDHARESYIRALERFERDFPKLAEKGQFIPEILPSALIHCPRTQ